MWVVTIASSYVFPMDVQSPIFYIAFVRPSPRSTLNLSVFQEEILSLHNNKQNKNNRDGTSLVHPS